jgi:hypothetical protein
MGARVRMKAFAGAFPLDRKAVRMGVALASSVRASRTVLAGGGSA